MDTGFWGGLFGWWFGRKDEGSEEFRGGNFG